MDKVTINTDLLGQVVLNYFEDVDRLKKFEGIKRTNEDKIYGYETFWLLRDKPIQVIDSNMPNEYLYINETVSPQRTTICGRTCMVTLRNSVAIENSSVFLS